MAKSKILSTTLYISILLFHFAFSLNDENSSNDLYVGYPGNKNNYATVSKLLKHAHQLIQKVKQIESLYTSLLVHTVNN